MATKLTKAQLAELAKELVAEYQGYIHRPENPFGSRERTSLDKTVDKLEKMGLASFYTYRHKGSKIFRIVDKVHGSCAMFATDEPKFLDRKFAVAVRDELERTKIYQGAQVIEEVG
jgi:hypothetical protein